MEKPQHCVSLGSNPRPPKCYANTTTELRRLGNDETLNVIDSTSKVYLD